MSSITTRTKYRWTQQDKEKYEQLMKEVNKLTSPPADENSKASLIPPNDQGSIKSVKTIRKLSDYTDIPYDLLKESQWFGPFPKAEVTIEFFQNRDKLSVLYIESDDLNLDARLQDFIKSDFVSMFVTFNVGIPGLLTITSGRKCMIIHVQDDITAILDKFGETPIIFPQQHSYANNNDHKKIKQFLKSYGKKKLNVIKLDDYPFIKGLEAFPIISSLIHVPYYRPSIISINDEKTDDKLIHLSLSMAFETYFIILGVEILDKMKTLEDFKSISYEMLVETSFQFQNDWTESKTITVGFSESESFEISYKIASEEEVCFDDDWRDSAKYYYFHVFKEAGNHYYFVVGDAEKRRILIIQGKINPNIKRYFGNKNYNFVCRFVELPICRKIGLSKGYIVDKKIYKKLKRIEHPWFNPVVATNSSLSQKLSMAYVIYLIMKAFEQQSQNDPKPTKQRIDLGPEPKNQGPKPKNQGPKQ